MHNTKLNCARATVVTHENLNFSRWMTHNNLSKCWSNSPVKIFKKDLCAHRLGLGFYVQAEINNILYTC